ncbi:MAG: methyltransferase domain-containing protein [Geminicoccales bacterium]
MSAMSDEAIVALYSSIVSSETMDHCDRSDGWFKRYNGDLADPVMGQRYVSSVRNKLGDFGKNLSQKTVLDIGCGFGLTCTTIAAMGAKEVHGIDNFEPMVETFQAYAATLPFGDRLHPAKSPADKLPYADNSFDIVLTVEALSHIANTEGYMIEAHRVLKPGGVLLIADDNNAANPKIVQRNKEIWERFENGPPTDDIYGHSVRMPYLQSRQSILREGFPALSDEEVEKLSRNTAYMNKAEILHVAERYLDDQEMPNSYYDGERSPIQPETGHTMEALLDPYDLKDNLNRMGFQAEVTPYLFGESRGGITYQANRMICDLVGDSLLFRYCEGLRVTAVKNS